MHFPTSKPYEYHWNQKIWTLQEFDFICRREGVEALTLPMPVPGFYGVFEGVPVIAINSSLPINKQLEVGLHELGHFWLHPPNTAFYDPMGLSKIEFEAQAIAACGMIPRPLLQKLLSSAHILRAFYMNDIYSPALVAFRIHLYRHFGL